MKQCSVCKEYKTLTEFYSQKKESKKRGEWIYYRPECKECTAERAVKWQEDNRDRYEEYYTQRNIETRQNMSEERKLYHRQYANNQRKQGYLKKWYRNNKEKRKGYNDKRMHKNHEITREEWLACKEYFNNECAYCGITYDEQKLLHNQDLHKEHVNHEGENDLSNCVPACKNCNCQKWAFEFDEWYNKNNPVYSIERYQKIIKWIDGDYLNFT